MLRRVTIGAVVLSGIGAVPALAFSVKHRTVLISRSANGGPASDAASQPALAGRGTIVAYVLPVRDGLAPGGSRTDVFTAGPTGAGRRDLSRAPDGTAADGPSDQPAVSRSGARVAFVSSASNLVAGDTNGVADIVVRGRSGLPVRASVASDGTQANGPSAQPDISGDGRFVVFSSVASNLVPGDTNGRVDIFLRDLKQHTTRRMSVDLSGGNANGDSTAPALSADGRTIVFTSTASNLVGGDTNGVADVFARPVAGKTERVSVSTSGRQQDKAVGAPFTSEPDVSGDGRYVVFDTDATTLYPRDRNRRTDIYIRDRKAKTTTLVSASSLNVQGNNDSVTPRITPNGRFVTFQSFASNLFPADVSGADLFVRDRLTGTTSLVNATDNGRPRRAEPGRATTLQTAPISDDAGTALFLSAAAGVTGTRSTVSRQLYVRKLSAPRLLLARPVQRNDGLVGVSVRTDDKAATRYLCRIDRAAPYYCGPTVVVSRDAGRRLTIRVGGPGMRWSLGISVVLSVR